MQKNGLMRLLTARKTKLTIVKMKIGPQERRTKPEVKSEKIIT